MLVENLADKLANISRQNYCDSLTLTRPLRDIKVADMGINQEPDGRCEFRLRVGMMYCRWGIPSFSCVGPVRREKKVWAQCRNRIMNEGPV